MGNGKSRLFGKLLGILTVALTVLTVHAAPAADAMPPLTEGKKGNLTVVAKDGTMAVDGITFTAYKVATITVDKDGVVEYTLVEPFETSGVEFKGMTVSQSIAAAKKLAGEVKGLTGTEGTTDTTGSAKITDLDPGMYLVVDTKHAGTADKYRSLEPFLVSVPTAVMGKKQSDNAWEYDVEAAPKSTLKKKSNPTPPGPPGPNPGRTCQDDGFPEGYYWDEDLKACVIGPNRMIIPNTSVK